MDTISKSLSNIGDRLTSVAGTCAQLGAPAQESQSDTGVCEEAHRNLVESLIWAIRDVYTAALRYRQGDNNPYLGSARTNVRNALGAAITLADHPTADPVTRARWWDVYSNIDAIRADLMNTDDALDAFPAPRDAYLARDADQLTAVAEDLKAASQSKHYRRETNACLESAARDVSYAADTARRAIYTTRAEMLAAEAERETLAAIDAATEAENANNR